MNMPGDPGHQLLSASVPAGGSGVSITVSFSRRIRAINYRQLQLTDPGINYYQLLFLPANRRTQPKVILLLK